MNDSCIKEIKQTYWKSYSWIQNSENIIQNIADLVEQHLFEDLLEFF